MILLVFLLEFFFAVSNLLVKEVSSFGFPFFAVGLRLLIAASVLLAYQFIKDKREFKRLKNWKVIILAGVCNAYITNAYGLWGYHYLPTGVASFIYNLSPFVTAILAYIAIRATLTRRQWLAVLSGILGFLPALILNCNFYCSTALPLFILAFFSVLFAMLAGSYGWIMLKQLLDDGMPLALANGITLFLGSFFSFAHSFIIQESVALDYDKLTYIIALALLSQVVCYPFYSYLLKRYSTVFLSFASLISTGFTAALAFIFFHEPITVSFIISMLLVSCCLYIFYLDE